MEGDVGWAVEIAGRKGEEGQKEGEQVHETGSPDKIFFSYVYFRSIPSKPSHHFLYLSLALFYLSVYPFVLALFLSSNIPFFIKVCRG